MYTFCPLQGGALSCDWISQLKGSPERCRFRSFRFLPSVFFRFFFSVFFGRFFFPFPFFRDFSTFSSVFFHFFRFLLFYFQKKKRGDTVRETPFAKPRLGTALSRKSLSPIFGRASIFRFAPFAGHPSFPSLRAFLPVSSPREVLCSVEQGCCTELGEEQLQNGPLHKLRQGNGNPFPKSAREQARHRTRIRQKKRECLKCLKDPVFTLRFPHFQGTHRAIPADLPSGPDPLRTPSLGLDLDPIWT